MAFDINYAITHKIKEKRMIIDNLELRTTDITTATINTLDNNLILLQTNLDVDLSLQVYADSADVAYREWDGNDWMSLTTIITKVTAGTTAKFNLNTIFPFLTSPACDKITIRVRAMSVPTSGNISLIHYGKGV